MAYLPKRTLLAVGLPLGALALLGGSVAFAYGGDDDAGSGSAVVLTQQPTPTPSDSDTPATPGSDDGPGTTGDPCPGKGTNDGSSTDQNTSLRSRGRAGGAVSAQ
jgi:hypothetical protein